MNLPKYVTLQKLNGRCGSETEFDPIPPTSPWWRVILDRIFPDKVASLREENLRLTTRLLTVTDTAMDSGRIGLKLLDENEQLRDKKAFSMEDREAEARRDQKFIDLNKKNKQLNRDLEIMTERYNKLAEDVNGWITIFGGKE